MATPTQRCSLERTGWLPERYKYPWCLPPACSFINHSPPLSTIKFFAPLALAAAVVAAPLAEAEANGASYRFPTVSCANDISTVLTKLCNQVKANPSVINGCGKIPTFQSQLLTFAQALVSIGITIDIEL